MHRVALAASSLARGAGARSTNMLTRFPLQRRYAREEKVQEYHLGETGPSSRRCTLA